jgi:hypothetical protein
MSYYTWIGIAGVVVLIVLFIYVRYARRRNK